MSTDAKKAAAEEAITEEALTRYQATTDPRLREIILSLITHLHGFARDVRLTEDEYLFAMNYLVQLGGYCKGGRHEFLALAEMLGLETLVIQISQPKPEGATLPGVLGPFFVPNAPTFENGADLAGNVAGEPLYVSGRILAIDRRPVPNATINVWQSDGRGLYDVQGDLAKDGMRTRGQLKSEPDGRYSFWTVLPIGYPVPNDGGMGDLVKYTSNGGWRPAHVHFKIEADGHDTLVTQICVRESEYLDRDAAFSVRDGLIADFPRHQPGKAPDGRQMDRPFHTMDYDFVLTRA